MSIKKSKRNRFGNKLASTVRQTEARFAVELDEGQKGDGKKHGVAHYLRDEKAHARGIHCGKAGEKVFRVDKETLARVPHKHVHKGRKHAEKRRQRHRCTIDNDDLRTAARANPIGRYKRPDPAAGGDEEES